MKKVFDFILFKGVELSPQSDHIVVHMDDTIIRKTGKKVCGVSWRRDPLGPPFHTNFILGQRFIQLSLAIPEKPGIGRSRAVPIQLEHCPTPAKPKKDAPASDIEKFKEDQKQMRLNSVGVQCIQSLRKRLDDHDMKHKKLVVCVDGSYTNGTVLKGLPKNTSLIGRIRKDAKFNKPVVEQSTKGRNKVYGDQVPTPEQIRQSDLYPWKSVKCWAAGKTHSFDVKVVEDLLWRKAGQKTKLRLIIIRPLGYRLTKASKLLYRQPAYLICTDHTMGIQKVLQYYLWRWEIEVNIGEEKGYFGVGKAHVRNETSVENVPAFVTAIYSLLLLAHLKMNSSSKLPRPKWYPTKDDQRVTTGDLINNFKARLYCKATGIHFSHFVSDQLKSRSTKKSIKQPVYAHFYGRAS